jgi:hypothetical protein
MSARPGTVLYGALVTRAPAMMPQPPPHERRTAGNVIAGMMENLRLQLSSSDHLSPTAYNRGR